MIISSGIMKQNIFLLIVLFFFFKKNLLNSQFIIGNTFTFGMLLYWGKLQVSFI